MLHVQPPLSPVSVSEICLRTIWHAEADLTYKIRYTSPRKPTLIAGRSIEGRGEIEFK